MIYFTSDWHLNEYRLGNNQPNVFFRNFENTKKNNEYFRHFLKDTFKDGDTIIIKNQKYFLNHYPVNCLKQDKFSICGHIHGAWKIQPNMINVGWDCWKSIVSEEIAFITNAMKKYYDENVFPFGIEHQMK